MFAVRPGAANRVISGWQADRRCVVVAVVAARVMIRELAHFADGQAPREFVPSAHVENLPATPIAAAPRRARGPRRHRRTDDLGPAAAARRLPRRRCGRKRREGTAGTGFRRIGAPIGAYHGHIVIDGYIDDHLDDGTDVRHPA